MDHPYEWVFSTLPEFFLNEWLWYEYLMYDEYGAYNVNEICVARSFLCVLGFNSDDFMNQEMYEQAVGRVFEELLQ